MRGGLPLPPFPRASRRGRRPRRPTEACANVLPRVTTRGDSRCRQHPRRGQDPSLRTEPLTPAYANPRAGHARPLPRGGPETGAHVNLAGVSISPSVGRGAPTPPRPSVTAHSRANRRGLRPRRPAEACADANNSPCLPPRGKVAPQGRMRGKLPSPPIPRVTTRGDSRCRQHPWRGQDPSLRTEPLTPAYATPRAGHARPLPRGGPETAAHVNPTAFPYPPIRRAGCPHPAATSRRRQHPGRDESLHYNPCLPPWGKVAPQGRMRGRLPLPPIPGKP